MLGESLLEEDASPLENDADQIADNSDSIDEDDLLAQLASIEEDEGADLKGIDDLSDDNGDQEKKKE